MIREELTLCHQIFIKAYDYYNFPNVKLSKDFNNFIAYYNITIQDSIQYVAANKLKAKQWYSAHSMIGKKTSIEIITTNSDMSDVLLAIFPHSATLTKVEGAYSHNDKINIMMIVSSNEVKRVIRIAKSIDKHSFIMTYRIHQVYGNFFVRPTE